MKELEEMLSTEKVDVAFKGTNFGSMSNRDVIRYSLLKYATGYCTGHTAKQVCTELGLVSKSGLTKAGKQYLYEAFCEGNSM